MSLQTECQKIGTYYQGTYVARTETETDFCDLHRPTQLLAAFSDRYGDHFHSTKFDFQTPSSMESSSFREQSNGSTVGSGWDLDLQALDLTPTAESTQMTWVQQGAPLTVDPNLMSQHLRSSNEISQILNQTDLSSALHLLSSLQGGGVLRGRRYLPCRIFPRTYHREVRPRSLQKILD